MMMGGTHSTQTKTMSWMDWNPEVLIVKLLGHRWASSPNQSGRKKHVRSPLVWANRWSSSPNQSGPNKKVRSPLVWAINGPQAQTKVGLRNMRGPLWLGPIGPKQSKHKCQHQIVKLKANFNMPRRDSTFATLAIPILARYENNVHTPICLLWWFQVLD